MFSTWINLCMCLFSWTEGSGHSDSVSYPSRTEIVQERFSGSWVTDAGNGCSLILEIVVAERGELVYRLVGQRWNASGRAEEELGVLILEPQRRFYYNADTGTLHHSNLSRYAAPENNIPECPEGPLRFIKDTEENPAK